MKKSIPTDGRGYFVLQILFIAEYIYLTFNIR